VSRRRDSSSAGTVVSSSRAGMTTETEAALGGSGQSFPEPGVLGVGHRRASTALVEQPPQGLICGAWAHRSSRLETRVEQSMQDFEKNPGRMRR